MNAKSEQTCGNWPHWIRTCQECGHVQEAQRPNRSMELPTSYTDARCKLCKSMALDYGKWVTDE